MLLPRGFHWFVSPIQMSAVGLGLLFAFSAVARAQIVPSRDDRVGVCTHFAQSWSVPQVMPLVANSGVGWIRDDLPWAELEPTPGNYAIPAKTLGWIQAARQAGLKMVVILGYGNPAYADPYDVTAYANAAEWLARALGDNVQALEILNEPNNFGFRDLYGGAWNGNEPDGSVSPWIQRYVQLLNAAARKIKLANPLMKVIGLGAPPPADFRMIALGLVPQVGGLTDHPYGGSLPELVPYPATPSTIQRDGIATADINGTFSSQVSMFRTQARKWGATEQLWHTEWGYSTVQPQAGSPGLTEPTQAVYTLRRLLESHANGVEHTFIYDFKDEGVDPYAEYDNFGLIHNDLSPKLAYGALQRVTGLLTGTVIAASTKQASIENDPGSPDGLGNRCHTFSSSDQQTIVVAFWTAKSWDPSATPQKAVIDVPLALTPGHVFLYDLLSGSKTEVPWQNRPNAGISVAVSISASPQLLMVR